MALSFVVASKTSVSTILAKAMRPAVIHGDATVGWSACGCVGFVSARWQAWLHGSGRCWFNRHGSIGTMESSIARSEEMDTFGVGCGEVVTEVVHGPLSKGVLAPVTNSISKEASALKNTESGTHSMGISDWIISLRRKKLAVSNAGPDELNGLIRIPISLHLLFIGEEAVRGDNSIGSGEVLEHLANCHIRIAKEFILEDHEVDIVQSLQQLFL